mmetsp:Transcript_60188/g.131849  ORF Transcript_60188/g.131849 Transcript_60188/m.131849 type:complete len:695 (-) Transcript_60188:155-2239(-)
MEENCPRPRFWLHWRHGGPGAGLVPFQVPSSVGLGDNVSEAFSAGVQFPSRSSRAVPSVSGESIVGAQCYIAGHEVCVEGLPGSGIDVRCAELSSAPLTAAGRPDLVAILVVLPANNEGLTGTQANSVGTAGRDCWCLLTSAESRHETLDTLGSVGALRNDLHEVLQAPADGEGVIGEGAYATVRCMRTRDGRVVAAKCMNAQVELPAVSREIATLIEVQPHEHIVGYRGIFWHFAEGAPRLVVGFEAATCGDLLYRVLKSGAMAEVDARTLFHGVMKALAHIHARSIVHRDIKAENILLKRQDVAVVADFGLATVISDQAQMQRRCGSPGYVAPEVCLGVPYDFKVDVFGAGVVLYFLLSQEMPFSSPDRDTAATMRRTVKCSLHLHRAPWDRLTSRLRNILRQTICKEQSDRLSSAQVLEHQWLTGPAPRPALTAEQLQQLQMQQLQQQQQAAKPADTDSRAAPIASDKARNGEDVDTRMMRVNNLAASQSVGASGAAPNVPPAAPTPFCNGPGISGGVAAGLTSNCDGSFGPTLSGGYPTHGGNNANNNNNQRYDNANGNGGNFNSYVAQPPASVPGLGFRRNSQQQNRGGEPMLPGVHSGGAAGSGGPATASFHFGGGRSPTHSQQQGRMVPLGGDEEEVPRFPVGAGAVVAEARASSILNDVNPSRSGVRNSRRLGGLPPTKQGVGSDN